MRRSARHDADAASVRELLHRIGRLVEPGLPVAVGSTYRRRRPSGSRAARPSSPSRSRASRSPPFGSGSAARISPAIQLRLELRGTDRNRLREYCSGLESNNRSISACMHDLHAGSATSARHRSCAACFATAAPAAGARPARAIPSAPSRTSPGSGSIRRNSLPSAGTSAAAARAPWRNRRASAACTSSVISAGISFDTTEISPRAAQRDQRDA